MLIKFEGKAYPLEPQETVLDCLLRHGIPAPHACKNGVCHTCMMRALSGEPGTDAQKGLKVSRAAQNYFLPCSCIPNNNLEVVYPDAASLITQSSVHSIEKLSADIVRLRLQKPDDFSYYAGQFVTLYHPENIGRNYSLASLPGDDFLEFHVRLYPNGKVSQWIGESLKQGDKMNVSEAIGDCFYLARKMPSDKSKEISEQPLLLMGTGTGLAPLYGIVRDALSQGHHGPLHLYHGSRSLSGLYLVDYFKKLEAEGKLHYTASLSGQEAPEGMVSGRANELALNDHPKLNGWRVYICGNPDFVKHAQRAAFLAGASMQDIYRDAFVASSF